MATKRYTIRDIATGAAPGPTPSDDATTLSRGMVNAAIAAARADAVAAGAAWLEPRVKAHLLKLALVPVGWVVGLLVAVGAAGLADVVLGDLLARYVVAVAPTVAWAGLAVRGLLWLTAVGAAMNAAGAVGSGLDALISDLQHSQARTTELLAAADRIAHDPSALAEYMRSKAGDGADTPVAARAAACATAVMGPDYDDAEYTDDDSAPELSLARALGAASADLEWHACNDNAADEPDEHRMGSLVDALGMEGWNAVPVEIRGAYIAGYKDRLTVLRHSDDPGDGEPGAAGDKA